LNEFAYYPLDYLGKGWLVSDKAGYFSEPILSEIELDIDVQIESQVEAEAEIESEAEIEVVVEDVLEDVLEDVAEVVEPIEIIIPVEPDKQETQQQPDLELSSSLSIQIGVFSNEPDVNLLPFDFNLFTLILPNGLYKVFAGPYENVAERAKYKQKLIEAGFTDVFNVVAKP
jgi:hypothetical protein